MAYRYAWDLCPNDEYCNLHTDAEFFDYHPMFECERDKKQAGLTTKQLALVNAVEAIPGVVSVTLDRRYEVTIQKAGVFAWEEVQSKVLDALHEYLGQPLVEAPLKQKPMRQTLKTA